MTISLSFLKRRNQIQIDSGIWHILESFHCAFFPIFIYENYFQFNQIQIRNRNVSKTSSIFSEFRHIIFIFFINIMLLNITSDFSIYQMNISNFKEILLFFRIKITSISQVSLFQNELQKAYYNCTQFIRIHIQLHCIIHTGDEAHHLSSASLHSIWNLIEFWIYRNCLQEMTFLFERDVKEKADER